jgi:hypothetical protein
MLPARAGQEKPLRARTCKIDGEAAAGAVILVPSSKSLQGASFLSFFDDDEATEATVQSPRTPRVRARATPRPSPRRPQQGGGGAGGGSSHERQQLLMRRRIAAGAGVVLLIVIVLVVNGCLKGRKEQALKDYNQSVTQIVGKSDEEVSRPLFATLAGAAGSTPQQVEQHVNEYREAAKTQAQDAEHFSVPGEMTAAQRNLLLALNLRTEGIDKVGEQVRTALGGQSQQASTYIAGAMGTFLASDVLYSQRVAPLIQEALKAAGINESTPASSPFLPNVGWLEPTTVQNRLTGKSSSSSSSGPLAPGTHGHALTGVSVGATTLQPSSTGAVNHVKAGANPTFTLMVENSGSNAETNVKVEVSVTSGGVTKKATHTIDKTEPGATVPVDIPVQGVTLNAASRVTGYIQPVPGEVNIENNKQTYDVVFE